MRPYWPVTKTTQVQEDYRNQTSQESDDNDDDESDSNNHLKITQKIFEQRTGKARNQGTTRHSLQGTANILGKGLK